MDIQALISDKLKLIFKKDVPIIKKKCLTWFKSFKKNVHTCIQLKCVLQNDQYLFCRQLLPLNKTVLLDELGATTAILDLVLIILWISVYSTLRQREKQDISSSKLNSNLIQYNVAKLVTFSTFYENCQ